MKTKYVAKLTRHLSKTHFNNIVVLKYDESDVKP